jgi:hypothetical protein
MDIIAAGNKNPFKLGPKYISAMPDVMGRHHLNTLIQCTAPCNDLASMHQAVGRVLPNEQLRTRLCKAIWDIRESFLTRFAPEERPRFRILLLFNALRLNAPFKELYRPNLDEALEEIMDRAGDIGRMIEDIKQKATTYLADSHGNNIQISSLLRRSSERDIGVLKIFNNPMISRDAMHIAENLDESQVGGEMARIRNYVVEQLANM